MSSNGTIKAVGKGTTTVTATYNGVTYTCTITVKAATSQTDIRKVMAAYGIDCAFKDAKYPSTLVLNNIKYEEGIINGYKDKIDRMVLRFYGKNGLGGYSDLYVVVLKVPSKKNYSDAKQYKNIYLTTNSFNGEPGLFLFFLSRPDRSFPQPHGL